MGKSSPTGLQLKHIPDVVVMQTVYTLQNTWTVWVGAPGEISTYRGNAERLLPERRLHYQQKRTAHLDEICQVLRPLPKKLVWRKLQKLENRGMIMGFGPSGMHFAVTDTYWESLE